MRPLLTLIAIVFLVTGVATIKKPHATWMPPNGSKIQRGDSVSKERSRVYGFALVAAGAAFGVAAVFWKSIVETKDGANQRPDGTSAEAPPSKPSQGAAVPHP